MKKILLLLVFSNLIFNIGCRRAQKKPKSNILQVGLSSEISTIDPARSYDVVSGSVVYQVYETLFEYHYLKRPLTIQPLLSAGMPKVENAGKKFTIKILEGVEYHPNKCFNGQKRNVKAEDFITQFKRLAYLPTHSNGWWIFENKVKGLDEFRAEVGSDFEKFKTTQVEGLKAIDDQTLVIELKEAYPQLIYVLAMSFTTPLPMEVVTCLNNNLDEEMVGTGPFMLESWTKKANLRLVRFNNYRETVYPHLGDRFANDQGLLKDSGKKLPFLDGITFHIMKEAQTRWLNFMAEKVDFLAIPKDNFSSAIDPTGKLTKELSEKNIQLQISPTTTFWWISFNMKDPLLGKNKNLRLAIAHATNVEEYINTFTNNIGQKANSIYPPGIFGYDPSRDLPYYYDLNKAKEYLEKAGYPGGKGLPEIVYDVRGNSATNRQQAEFIKSELKKIGINVRMELNTFPGFLEKARNGNLQMWQDGWALDYPDAENVLQLLISKNHPPGPNATYYSNPEIDKMFNKMKFLNDGPEKKDLLDNMEQIIHEELPWVMQYYARNYILYHNRLQNFRTTDLINNYYKYLRLE